MLPPPTTQFMRSPLVSSMGAFPSADAMETMKPPGVYSGILPNSRNLKIPVSGRYNITSGHLTFALTTAGGAAISILETTTEGILDVE